MSEWYDWCKANHVCYRCGKVRADEGYTTCLACRMALRERKKELRRDHINPSEIRSRQRQREQEQTNRAMGLCRCGKPVTAGYKTCVSCRTRARLAAANKPTFACNLPNMHMQFGGLWEVDLRQVACITSDHLKLVEIEKPEEQEEEDRPVSSYKNRSRSQGWRRGNVTCHNCGADYETDINEKWAYVKCKYCHESDTTVTYDD